MCGWDLIVFDLAFGWACCVLDCPDLGVLSLLDAGIVLRFGVLAGLWVLGSLGVDMISFL